MWRAVQEWSVLLAVVFTAAVAEEVTEEEYSSSSVMDWVKEERLKDRRHGGGRAGSEGKVKMHLQTR
jgi:hypothetical protein